MFLKHKNDNVIGVAKPRHSQMVQNFSNCNMQIRFLQFLKVYHLRASGAYSHAMCHLDRREVHQSHMSQMRCLFVKETPYIKRRIGVSCKLKSRPGRKNRIDRWQKDARLLWHMGSLAKEWAYSAQTHGLRGNSINQIMPIQALQHLRASNFRLRKAKHQWKTT